MSYYYVYLDIVVSMRYDYGSLRFFLERVLAIWNLHYELDL
jgi:hypothetical protein